MNEHGGEALEVQADDHLSTYNKIIVILTLATAAEFGVAALIVPGDAAASTIPFALGLIILVAMAAYKAVLVGKVFMHLKYDPKILAWIILTPIVLGTPLVLVGIYDAVNGPGF